MKTKISVLLLSFFLIHAITVMAHEKDKHIKGQEDTAATVATGHHDEATHAHQTDAGHHEQAGKKEKASFDAFPTLHPLVVHFPIVLLLMGFLAQLSGLFVFRSQLNWVTLFLVFGGLAGAYIAGQFVHPHTTGLSETAAWLLEQHEKYADYTLWTALVAFLLKILSMFILKKKVWLEITIVFLLGASAFYVSETGHYGAQLLHIEGVGAKGNFIEQNINEDNHSHNH